MAFSQLIVRGLVSHTFALSVGQFEMESLQEHEQAVHTEHALSFIESGELSMEHGDKIVAKSGDVIIVPAGVPHRLLQGSHLKIRWLGFCVSCLDIEETQTLMIPFRRVKVGALPVITIPEARRSRLCALFTDLAEEQANVSRESFDVIRSLLLLVLKEIYRSLADDQKAMASAPNSLTQKALNYIQLHCLEPISLKHIAQALHKTPAHLTATVKKSTGYSVGQWLTKARLSEACKRLAHSELNVEEIAVKVGWVDVTHFIRQFKKEFGTTPAAWRKQNRKFHQ